MSAAASIALRIRHQAACGLGEVVWWWMQREHVEQRPLGRRGKADAVGGDGRHAKRRGQRDERRVIGVLVASKMALQLDVDAVAAEDADEPIEQAADTVPPAVERARPASATRPAVQTVELVERSAPSPLGARSFMRVISRQGSGSPRADSQRTGSTKSEG